jgi:hypothetical protein
MLRSLLLNDSRIDHNEKLICTQPHKFHQLQPFSALFSQTTFCCWLISISSTLSCYVLCRFALQPTPQQPPRILLAGFEVVVDVFKDIDLSTRKSLLSDRGVDLLIRFNVVKARFDVVNVSVTFGGAVGAYIGFSE